MSKASTTTAKTPTQLPSRSPWARGPPQSNSSSTPSPRSQSPAPSHTAIPISHSRRPSALGQGLSVKDSVAVPRNNVGSIRPGSVVFGSIDDASAPLSSSPASTPAIKTEVIKFFGTVPATSSNHVNGKTTASSSATGSLKQPARPSISSPFNSSTTTSNAATSTASASRPTFNKADIAKFFRNPSSLSSQPSSDMSSPSTRPHNLPPHHQPSSSTSQLLLQPSQLDAHPYAQIVPGMRQTQHGAGVPRSPVFTRAVANMPGQSRPGGGSGGPGGPPINVSPRMAPHPRQAPPTGMAPQVPMQPIQWGGYYYPMDPYTQPQHSWYYPMASPSCPAAPQLPGTPTMAHAILYPPHTPQPPPSVSSPHNSQPPTVPIPPASPVVTGRRITTIRIESEETRRLREEALRKEQEKKDAEEHAMKEEEEEEEGEHEGTASPVVTSHPIMSIQIEIEGARRRREETLRKEQERKKKQDAKREKDREEWIRKKEEDDENGRLRREEEEHLEKAAKRNVSAPLPSALPTVRFIKNLSDVVYPEGIKSPQVELNNANVTNGRFRYDREFLMQFMHICMEKPPTFHLLNALGFEPVYQSSFAMDHGSSAAGLDIGNFQKPSVLGPFQTDNLLSTGSKLTIQERLPPSPGGKGNKRKRAKRGNRWGSAFGSSIPTDVSEADAKKKVDEDVKEFFAVRNLEEADVYFINLPREHRFRLVEKLVASALERKGADARLVGNFFARAARHGQCTQEIFEDGFRPTAESLDDIAIDAPKAFSYMTIMLKGAGLEKEPERLQRIASKLDDSNKLLSLVAVAENEFYMSHGDESNQEYSPDDRAVTGGSASRPPPSPKPQFGKISTGAPMATGPGSVFAGGKKESKRDSLSRTSSNSNMFHILSQNPVDQSPEALALRKKLQLLPRFMPSGTNRQKAED